MNQKPQVRPKSFLGRAWGAGWAVVGVVAVAVVTAIIVETGGILLGWWGMDHSRVVLKKERSYIGAIDKYPLLQLSPLSLGDAANKKMEKGLEKILLKTGIHRVARAGEVVLNSAKLITHRAAVSAFALPGYLLVMLVAFIEGMVFRDTRKYTGAHESSYVFHKSKNWILPAVGLTVAVYFLLPFAVVPALMFAPSLCLTGFMTYLAAGSFKKLM